MINEKKIAFCTLLAGFMCHALTGTFHTWPSLSKYFNSYLHEKNSSHISKVYLNNVFSLVNVFHNIFIFIGIILNKYYSSVTITGIGLLLKIISNAFFIFIPNIKIVTLMILFCSIGCGISYMPIILDVWKYFPNNKGLATSLVLSGFALTELLFEDISIKLINPEKDNFDFTNCMYSSFVNNNFKLYLKKSEIFFCIVSVICIMLIYPYDNYKKYFTNSVFGKNNKKNKYTKELNNDINYKGNENNNNLGKNDNEQSKNNNNNEYKNYNSPHLMRVKEQNRIKKKNINPYIKKLTSLFLNKKEKQKITYNKKYVKEEDLDSEYNNSTEINLLKIIDNEKNNKESFISLISTYPFLQLTFIFFFTLMFGIIELRSMKNFGFLNGHSEDFLWYNSLLWKTTNLLFFPIWGYLFDKIGFKRIYRIVISLEILICGTCYYISYNKFGYIIYCFISALVNSGSIAIRPTNFSLIFDNEKGAFLFGFSCFLTNTFYIFRPLIWNLLTDKIYYLIIYLILTLFSMLGFIILCFFIDEKYIPVNYNNDSNDNEIGEEMKNIDYYDDNKNIYFITNNEKNGEKEHEESTSY